MSKIRPVIVLHGGAWAIPDNEVEAHERGIRRALEKGAEILQSGGDAVDVVEGAIRMLEDDPTFDAGRGSVLNTDGSVEMDASMQRGSDLAAGAVAALRNFPNPISIVRSVMEKTPHILLAGPGAVEFALSQGFKQVPVASLLTERELMRLEKLMADDAFQTPEAFGAERITEAAGPAAPLDAKRGTVGAVVMDADGLIAAGTSTGGTPKKIPGRVGDSAIIGAGTMADSSLGGVSCTGWGESIIQAGLARTVLDALADGQNAANASETGIRRLERTAKGLGGVIVVDSRGEAAMAFNTPRMARGLWRPGMESAEVAV